VEDGLFAVVYLYLFFFFFLYFVFSVEFILARDSPQFFLLPNARRASSALSLSSPFIC